jgi:hypothetical protein
MDVCCDDGPPEREQRRRQFEKENDRENDEGLLAEYRFRESRKTRVEKRLPP